jgi:hypothetical protein
VPDHEANPKKDQHREHENDLVGFRSQAVQA